MRTTAFLFGGAALLFLLLACVGLRSFHVYLRRSADPEVRASRLRTHRFARWTFAVLAAVSAWQCADSFRLAATWETDGRGAVVRYVGGVDAATGTSGDRAGAGGPPEDRVLYRAGR
ncbi:hypothetical protein [Streptomyces sp. cmx-4-25]|uniref:hypothetical protein n=1 Tax=Streptomyces sp. cmx-4-25 TaxID=2790933 RepID=UPI0039811CDD